MTEDRETAYPLVFGFLATLIVVFLIAVTVRGPSSKVKVVLTHPSASMKSGIGN